MAKLWITYICWFCGGIFGLHQFYLRRDKHAFVWWLSGGGLLVGWFRDLWRIPEYLHEANEHPGYMKLFAAQREMYHKPRFSVVRFAGELFIGMIFGYLFRLAIPEEVLTGDTMGYLLTIALPVFGSAVGVNLVGNIGHQKTPFKWSLVGAALAIPFLLRLPESIAIAPLFSAVLTYKKSEWLTVKPNKKGKKNFIKRVFVLFLCGSIYLSLWGSALYFNAHVTSRDGQKVPLRIAIHNFFQSPVWKQMEKTMWDLYEFCSYNGWGTCYQQLIEQLDPTGEAHAYRVLGFDSSRPTNDEIKSHCRQLARKWHPDKYKDEEEKQTAQVKFMEIQEACDKLDYMRKNRAERNMQSDGEDSQSNYSDFRDEL